MPNLRVLLFAIALLSTNLISFSQITEIGLASFYADKFQGRITASGDTFDQDKLTAAHRTLPFGSKVKVTNIKNNKSIMVVINDRGPFVKDRVIDLSKLGARKLEFMGEGITQVKVEVISLGRNGNKPAAPVKKAKPTAKKAKPLNTSNSSNPVNQPTQSQGSLANTNTNYEYYKLESSALTPSGFGIQVASYQEAANLIKRCDEIKKHIDKDLIIQVGNNNGTKIYRIIVGPFPSRQAANKYKESLKKFKGSFVMSF